MQKKKLIRFDWAMKYILRNKANFDVLEGFLANLLKETIKMSLGTVLIDNRLIPEYNGLG